MSETKPTVLVTRRMPAAVLDQLAQSCAVDLHLLYSQARKGVAMGDFAISEVEALLLASLTLQIEYGDYDPKKHHAGFLRDILQEYAPMILRQHAMT